MAKDFNKNSPHVPASISTAIYRTTKPSFEFYSIFSEEEVLRIIHSLELKREIPLKYSYKGKGAKIWNDFYLKYIIANWYRKLNLEVELLNKSFEYINASLKSCAQINIIDVGAGNSLPVKEFIGKLNKSHKINKYIALDISEELLILSKQNFKKWFPTIEFISSTIDIESSGISRKLLSNQFTTETEDAVNIFLHLGVTMGNHLHRSEVFKNFKESMRKNDFLVFTNELGSNSKWDGKVRGGCKYHVEQTYKWIKNNIGIRSEDCELVRKYDLETDSIVANIKLYHNYDITFNLTEIDKNIKISEGEEITIWRHHKYEIPELVQEIEQAGLQLLHYNTDKYSSLIMVICGLASD